MFPLRDATAYPGSDFIDMVFWMPSSEPKTLRLWMLTPATEPYVMIDDNRFTPQSTAGEGNRWIDLGLAEIPLEGTVPRRGFAQLRVFGVTSGQAKESYLVTAQDVEKVPSGSIEDVEELLWGIRRRDVGRTYCSPSAIEVGSPTEFRFAYEAGATGLPVRSFLRLAVPGAFALPQTQDPNADGFIHITHSDAECAIIDIAGSIESHEKVDVILELPQGLPRYGTVRITYRSDFTYLFESSFSEADRRYWYSRLPPLAPAVSVDGGKNFVPPLQGRGHAVRFVPREASRLHLFLPGRRKEGEPIRLVGILTDRFRNVVHKCDCPGIRLSLEGPRGRELPPVEGHFTAASRFEIPLTGLRPGVWRMLAMDANSGDSLATSNPLEIMPADSAKPNIYWGEIHGHSEMSDGSGSFVEMFRHAREIGCLDFAAGADHACYFSDNEWRWMQDVVNAHHEPGIFCTLIGYEWAGTQGHRNFYTSGRQLERYRGMYAPTRDLEAVCKRYAGRTDIVMGPHTLHAGYPDKFRDRHDPEIERFYEIYSVWGKFESIAVGMLNGGARLGFTGGGDCHEGRCGFSVEDPERQGEIPHSFADKIRYKCGMTAAVMPRLGRAELIHALRNRKTYATTGARILLDFSISGISMGDTGSATTPVVAAEVHAAHDIARTDIVRNGEVLATFAGETWHQTVNWTDTTAGTGRHWYFVKVTQRDGEIAWSSPVWVRT